MADSSSTPREPASEARAASTTRSRVAVALLSLAVVAVVAVAAARAGSCRVLVALGSVDFERSPAGMTVRASGTWEFDNLVQVADGLSFNLLMVREDHYVRLHYPDQAYAGTLGGLGAKLNDGLDGDAILAVEADGSPEPTARFLQLEAQRLKVSTPVLRGSGPISVVAYIVLDGDYVSPILSNTVSRVLDPVFELNEREGEGTLTEGATQ